MPILSQPLNHGPQSISGLINMTGYSILNVGKLGVGTSVPAYGVDVENDYINTNLGYLFIGGRRDDRAVPGLQWNRIRPGIMRVPADGLLPAFAGRRGAQPQEAFRNFDGSFNVVG